MFVCLAQVRDFKVAKCSRKSLEGAIKVSVIIIIIIIRQVDRQNWRIEFSKTVITN